MKVLAICMREIGAIVRNDASASLLFWSITRSGQVVQPGVDCVNADRPLIDLR